MFTALGAPQDFEIFDWFLYHFKSIATEQLFITIVFQTNNKKFFYSTLVHTLPFPLYSFKHAHEKLPNVLVQLALTWHECNPSAHSSISTKKRT